ncbi:hypothetical protein [Nevskia sp.]|uniref:hypothetical protein n=1 Tax=Nevskia sp. TaxID=1929292 RepID=UPI0025FAFEF9|nr:hypothetical protein [Nevskia sp.]
MRKNSWGFASILLSGLLALLPAASRAADPAPGSAIHGFADVAFKNDYITPRGLLVTNQGLTTQILGGIVFLTPGNTSIVIGTWNDINTDGADYQRPSPVGAWNEFDYFAGINWQPTKSLKVGAAYVVFLSPPGNFQTEHNIEFTAYYSDPYKLNPYLKVFWAVGGDSTVVLGRRGDTFDVEIGANPSYTFKSIGLTVSAPTWITVGPKNFWCDPNSGAAQFAASIQGSSCPGGNFGVFSTGIKASLPITAIGPQYGGWTFNTGVQYYNLLNGALVDAHALTVNSPRGYRHVIVPFAGVGFGF